MHPSKLVALKGFSEHVHPHLISGTVFKVNISTCILILDQKVFCTNALAMVRGRDAAIFEGHGTHVILVNDIVFNGIALSFEEIFHPEDVRKFVVNCDEFGFGGTFCIKFFYNFSHVTPDK